MPFLRLCGPGREARGNSELQHRPGCGLLCGRPRSTCAPQDARRFRQRRASSCNVGVLTRGVDDAGGGAHGAAHQSRSLYAQMAGRGTRPSEDIAGELNGAADDAARRAMIAASRKPGCLIVIRGNSGRHKLVSTVDIRQRVGRGGRSYAAGNEGSGLLMARWWKRSQGAARDRREARARG